MSFLHNQSMECSKSELDLFSLPPTQTSIELGQWVHYKPLASISDEAPIEFVVPGIGDEYIDLSHTLINLKVKIVNSDGSALNCNTCIDRYYLVTTYLTTKVTSVVGIH